MTLINDGGKNGVKWNKSECDQKYSFICKRPAQDYMFHFSTVEKSWTNAQEYCTNWGGTLASISDKKKETLIADLIDDEINYWIGLSSKNE